MDYYYDVEIEIGRQWDHSQRKVIAIPMLTEQLPSSNNSHAYA